MAETTKNLKIVITGDTSQIEGSFSKVSASLGKLEGQSDLLNTIEGRRAQIIAEQATAYAKLSASIDKINTSKLNESLSLNAAKASVNSFNKTLDETAHKLANLSIASNLGTSKLQTTSAVRPTGIFNYGTGSYTPTPVTLGETVPSAKAIEIASYARQRIKDEEDLTKSIRNRELAALKADITERSSKVKLNKDLDESINKHKSLLLHIIEIAGAYRAFNLVTNAVGDSLRAIPRIGIQLEATKAILTSTVGSEAGMASTMEALDKEAQRTGITISALRENFRLFQASTSLAGESLKDTWQMFTNINTVSTALHLSTDQTIGIFNALAQIFNKSKVQSEELVKQLGNLLPGAFASFQKANEGVYKSTQDLIAQMQKGAVFAHQTILNFTDFLRDRFAASFAVASNGLNANLGRMETSFTHLGETIYNLNSGPLNAAIKGITSFTNSINDSLKSGDSLIDTLGNIAALIGGVLVASLVKAAANAKILQTSLLSIGGTAVTTALTAVVLKIGEIGQKQGAIYDDAKQRLEAFNAEKLKTNIAEPIQIRVEASNTIKTARKDLENLQNELADIRRAAHAGAATRFVGEEGIVPISYAENKVVKAISDQKELIKKAVEAETLAIQKADQDAINNIVTGGVNLSQEMAQIHEDALKADGDMVGAALADWDNKYKAKVDSAKASIETIKNQLPKLTNESIKANLQDQLTKYQQFVDEAAKAREDAGTKAAGKEGKKEIQAAKENYREFEDLLKTQQANTAQAFEEEKANLATHLISFDEYYRRRKDIIEKSLESETSLQRGISQRAASAGDTERVKDSEEKLAQIKAKYSVESTKLEAERVAEAFASSKQLTDLTIEYYNATGEHEKALKLQLTERYALIEDALKKQIEAGQISKQEDLDHVQIIKNMAIAEAEAASAKADLVVRDQKYQEGLNRINILKNIGAITDLQAAIEAKSLSEEKIKIMEDEVAVNEKLLNSTQAGTAAYRDLQEKIRSGKEALSQFKLQADTVGSYFQNLLGPALSNSFTGFITGSMTAKQAFLSFGQSVMKTIADIAAQQLAKQIIGLAVNAISGAIGGSAGSVNTSGVGEGISSSSLSYSNISSSSGLSNIQFASQSANGNAVSGMSSISGSILSNATYFPGAKVIPLANGGVVAGEAGSEAVLPLKRNSKGKLGVSVDSQSSGGIIIQNINITMQDKQDATSQEQATMIGKAIREQLTMMVDKRIGNATRSGNMLNPTQVASAF